MKSEILAKTTYVIKITLVGSKPLIWRRFCIPGEITLDRLHDVIQIVMGWEECHLHRFEIDHRRFTEKPEEDSEGEEESGAILSELVQQAGTKFLYEYDFGDGWQHELAVESIDEVPEQHRACIACMDGKRACPPEDVGGICGYAEYLAALKDPKHPEHKSFHDWGGPFDPAELDLDAVNFELAKYCRWSRPRSVSTGDVRSRLR